jgi:predicted acetyltransferase
MVTPSSAAAACATNSRRGPHRSAGISGTTSAPARRQGYGTRLLALTLERARGAGLTHILLTCDTANIASARTIEKNGGRLENRISAPDTGEEVSRYWIAL